MKVVPPWLVSSPVSSTESLSPTLLLVPRPIVSMVIQHRTIGLMLLLTVLVGCSSSGSSGVTSTTNLPAYYQQLADQCKGSSCCLSSVDSMYRTNSTLSPPAGCPPGTQGNMLRCEDSYKWCEPGPPSPAGSAVSASPATYYQQLRDQCKGSSCCESSVGSMEQGGYLLEPDGGCPPDTDRNMLKCVDSYKWCESAAP